MRALQDLITEEILRWVEWKDVDMQYDFFNKISLEIIQDLITF